MSDLLEHNERKVKNVFNVEALPGNLTPEIMGEVIECIGRVRYGSVEIKIQDEKVVQIDTVEKRRL